MSGRGEIWKDMARFGNRQGFLDQNWRDLAWFGKIRQRMSQDSAIFNLWIELTTRRRIWIEILRFGKIRFVQLWRDLAGFTKFPTFGKCQDSETFDNIREDARFGKNWHYFTSTWQDSARIDWLGEIRRDVTRFGEIWHNLTPYQKMRRNLAKSGAFS